MAEEKAEKGRGPSNCRTWLAAFVIVMQVSCRPISEPQPQLSFGDLERVHAFLISMGTID